MEKLKQSKLALLQKSAWSLALLALISFTTGCATIQQKFLFFPTHHADETSLVPWRVNGEIIGYSRSVATPQTVWLLLHGNAGQASDRIYALPSFAADDSVFLLEYPGYGGRSGTPSKDSIDAAASVAYAALRNQFPHVPVCVAGESIGSGPASALVLQPVPPNKIVLVVPFDTLNSVVTSTFPISRLT